MKYSGKHGAPSDPYRLLFENVGHMVCTLDLQGSLDMAALDRMVGL